MYLLWKKSAKRVWKLLNIVLNSRLSHGSWLQRTVEAARHNEHTVCEWNGKTGGCLWECQQFLSTQSEPYETCRAREDFPIVIVSKYTGRPAQVKSMCGKLHRIDFKILLITYKALNGLAPQFLSELLSHYSPPVRYDLKTLAIW